VLEDDETAVLTIGVPPDAELSPVTVTLETSEGFAKWRHDIEIDVVAVNPTPTPTPTPTPIPIVTEFIRAFWSSGEHSAERLTISVDSQVSAFVILESSEMDTGRLRLEIWQRQDDGEDTPLFICPVSGVQVFPGQTTLPNGGDCKINIADPLPGVVETYYLHVYWNDELLYSGESDDQFLLTTDASAPQPTPTPTPTKTPIPTPTGTSTPIPIVELDIEILGSPEGGEISFEPVTNGGFVRIFVGDDTPTGPHLAQYPWGTVLSLDADCFSETVSWSGQIEAGQRFDNPLTVVMSRDRSIVLFCE
jgi:hypothetical protein